MTQATVTHTQTNESLDVPLVLGYETGYESTTVVHRIIGREDPDVTLSPVPLRTGDLQMWCHDEASAAALVALHRVLGVLSLTSDTAPTIAMTYVVGPGRLSAREEPGSSRWVVTVPYVEVTT